MFKNWRGITYPGSQLHLPQVDFAFINSNGYASLLMAQTTGVSSVVQNPCLGRTATDSNSSLRFL
jgi:hypothetical protein